MKIQEARFFLAKSDDLVAKLGDEYGLETVFSDKLIRNIFIALWNARDKALGIANANFLLQQVDQLLQQS